MTLIDRCDDFMYNEQWKLVFNVWFRWNRILSIYNNLSFNFLFEFSYFLVSLSLFLSLCSIITIYVKNVKTQENSKNKNKKWFHFPFTLTFSWFSLLLLSFNDIMNFSFLFCLLFCLSNNMYHGYVNLLNIASLKRN